MKRKILMFVAGVLSLTASASFAGPRSSGGGFVVVCPATPVSKASVELLDIYEIEKGYSVVPVTGDLRKEYFDAIGRLNARLGAVDYVKENSAVIQGSLTRFFQSLVWVDRADLLPPADDLGKKPGIPNQCRIQQVAYFDDVNGRIYMNRELYQEMNPRDQAGLVLHELLFHEFRHLNESNSQSSRRQVGLSFVDSALRPVYPMPIPEENMFWFSDAIVPEQVSGRTARMKLAFFKSVGIEKSVLVFESLFGRPVQSFTSVAFEPLDVEFEDVWIDNFAGGRMVRLIKTPNLKIDQKASVQGEAFGGLGYEVRIRGTTGSSLYLELLQDGKVLQEAYLDSH